MSKKIIRIFISIIAFVFLFGGAVYYFGIRPIYETEKILTFVKLEYNTNPIFSNNKLEPIKGGFDSVSKNSIGQYLVLTKFDIFNPTYSLVIDNPENDYFGEGYKEIRYIELKRNGIDTFILTNEKYSEIRKLSLAETLAIASKYDITTDFPGKEKYSITNYPPLSQEEINTNKAKLEAANKATQTNKEYKEYVQTTYSSLLTQYDEILNLVKTNNLNPEQIQQNKQSASTKIKALQTELQQIQTQLNNNQSYTLKNNITINSTEKTKKYIQGFIAEIDQVKKDNGVE